MNPTQERDKLLDVIQDLRDYAYKADWESVKGILWGDIVSELIEANNVNDAEVVARG